MNLHSSYSNHALRQNFNCGLKVIMLKSVEIETRKYELLILYYLSGS